MENLPTTCETHSLPMTSICIDEQCELNGKFLCDICLNSHCKEHKYIISVESLKNNLYEKLIDKNEEQSRAIEPGIANLLRNIEAVIENEFFSFTEQMISSINSLKMDLLDKIAMITENYCEEIHIWKKLKFQYEKSYINFALKTKDSQRECSFEKILEEDDDREEIDQSYAKPKFESDSLKSLFSVISKVLEKQMVTTKNGIISEMSSEFKTKIREEIGQRKKDLTKLIDENLNFSSKLDDMQFLSNNNSLFQNKAGNSSLQSGTSLINLDVNPGGNMTPTRKKKISLLLPKSSKRSISPMLNSIKSREASFLNMDQACSAQHKVFLGSPEKSGFSDKSENLKDTNRHTNYFSNIFSNFQSVHARNEVFNPESFNLKEKQEIFPDKKGEWYSLEYIEDYDLLACGYENGEIVIFKEPDLTIVRTYRPRYKRIRKIIYSPENSSIFASYDDGYIVVINVTSFKIKSYKMCSSQIYSMEILPNINAIAFGGVEKKILYSYILNLNKVLLFYDSNEGDIQCLFYEEKRDILVAGMRKSSMLFFKFSPYELLGKYEFNSDNDCCAMIIKKIKDDTILASGYFLQIYQFKFIGNDKIEFIGQLQITNFCYIHIYDILKLDENFILVDTFDDSFIVLVDIKNKKAIKTFECTKGIVQMKIFKQNLYLTSYSESLQKISL